MATLLSTIVVPSPKLVIFNNNNAHERALPTFRHFSDNSKRVEKVSSFIAFAVNGDPTHNKATLRRDGRNPFLSEGRDEDEARGSICPGCGVFMQDKDPNLLGYYQPKKVKVEEISGEDDDDDGFDDDDDDDDVEEEDGDDDEEGFLNGSESKLGEESEGLRDEFDWDSDDFEAKLLGENDDNLELDGFAPAGVGYGNITEEYLEKVKKKKVSKAEKKRMAKEAEKEKEEVTVCARCHSLRNYGQVKNQTAENLIPDFDFDRLISTRLMNPSGSGSSTVVVMVVDCVDFDGSFPKTAVKSLFQALERIQDNSKRAKKLPKLVLVATKVDLLPSQVSMRLSRDEQKMVEMRKELRPRTYRIKVSSPTIIVERAGSFAWTCKSWRIREEFARTVTSAIGLFSSTELPLQRAILPPILQLLNDLNPAVREAAILCIEEMYSQAGSQFRDELQRHNLPSSLVKAINARLEGIQPKVHSSDGISSGYIAGEIKPVGVNPKKSSPKAKSSSRETSLFGGEGDVTEKGIDPIKVYSEKELIREIDKIASTLVPEKDWSIRIAAMQRIEGLVFGGAADYPCFGGLLKQLVGPLSTQLSDRRSSIVKQACHLLCLLSKDLLGDFEACAELFIPVLLKLVVITVLVIAESADNCIKTMLRNCKVARVLPRIADCAKNDRSPTLRARCCDYALLILEHWPDEAEIQRSADLYEDMIRCCVSDAMSEVRSTARMCYRMFAKTWPECSRRLFSSFDPAIQRLINEEDGGMHRRHPSPCVRDRGALTSITSQASAPSNLTGYGTSAIVAMDRSSSLSSGTSIASGVLLSQAKSLGKGTERSLENVLHASKQKVSAIESMLRGLDLSDKHGSSALRSSSLDLGVDPPSSRDPPFPAAVTASNHLTGSLTAESTASGASKGSNRNGGLGLSDIITQIKASKDSGRLSYNTNVGNEPLSAFSSYSSKRASEKLQERSSVDENSDIRETRRYMNPNIDRQYMDTHYRDGNFRDSQNSYVPNFQRPLLRKNVAGRVSAGSRRSFDDSQLSLGEMSNYADRPASLHEALSEGLSSGSDWSARVAAFNYLHSLLQQGQKGIQEVVQNFEKVMKLFFQHLDDPHHKVAQAALSTLADIILACRKPFEGYMERMLPHVFSRLIDPKELVRKACSTNLEAVSKSYSIDSLLPALLRSLDEQRSPKAKLAVIEFAISSFNKHAMNPEGAANIGILKLWLAKLVPLVHDKNTKLKEAAITCIISVYSHFDSSAVLNFILSLSVDEQNSLRRALKQRTPRIEVDLMNYLQNKKERRSKSSYDSSDVVGASSEEGYAGLSRKAHYIGRYSAGSLDSDGGRKWSSQDSTLIKASLGQAASDETEEHTDSNNGIFGLKTKDLSYTVNSMGQNFGFQTGQVGHVDSNMNFEGLSSDLDGNGMMSSEHLNIGEDFGHEKEHLSELNHNHHQSAEDMKANYMIDIGPSIPQILHMICSGGDGNPISSKRTALQQLVEVSMANDHSVWTLHFNQILTAVLELLDDSDSSIRELALSLIVEMLKNQKDAMENSVEIVVEKLLNVTKDIVPKVSNDAEHCLSVVLSQNDPFRCLSVIVPLLVTEDEKTLVACINCLTKLVGRLSQEELMAQLPTFLPALFEAFGNQSADVRKTVVFCLVDIYMILGKAFLPYLEGLNSTQLKLVTIYANRISQARTGKSIDTTHD